MNNGFTGTLTSTATFSDEAQTREIDFIYDHNGMRTAKIVSENGRVEITEYTLHGKLITHLTKRTVDENGEESTEELHFFYDAQSRPAFVEYDGAVYRYVHNLQGDIVAIVDTAGNLVVEYKYDAWGKPISTTASLKTTLGELNPFRYRGYVYDKETELYYLRSRYYQCSINRFLNADTLIRGVYAGTTLYVYCNNKPICNCDNTGLRPIIALSVSSETAEQRRESCRIMNVASRRRKITNRSSAAKNKNDTLREALNEYKNITGREFIIEMIESGNAPLGDNIVITAEVENVYNSAGYVFSDVMSFLGFTGVSDVIASAISVGAFFLTGVLLDDATTSQISSMIACVGQVSESTASSLDNAMHKRYTIMIQASNTATNGLWTMLYKFDEGEYYSGVSISGINVPNGLGIGVELY